MVYSISFIFVSKVCNWILDRLHTRPNSERCGSSFAWFHCVSEFNWFFSLHFVQTQRISMILWLIGKTSFCMSKFTVSLLFIRFFFLFLCPAVFSLWSIRMHHATCLDWLFHVQSCYCISGLRAHNASPSHTFATISFSYDRSSLCCCLYLYDLRMSLLFSNEKLRFECIRPMYILLFSFFFVQFWCSSIHFKCISTPIITYALICSLFVYLMRVSRFKCDHH